MRRETLSRSPRLPRPSSTLSSTLSSSRFGALGALVLAACSAADALPEVSGTFRDEFLADGQRVTTPDRLPKSVAALIPDGKGGFETLLALVADDGHFTIPGVPAGRYYLRVQRTYPEIFVTEARELDMGAAYAFRSGAVVARKATPLTVKIRGARAWEATDTLALYSPGAGLFDEFSPHPDPAAAGATSFEFTKDLATFQGYISTHLIDGSKGDRLYVAQRAAVAGETEQRTRIAAAAAIDPFTQGDGEAVTVSAELQVPTEKRVTFTWQRAAFAALAKDAHPDAVPLQHALAVFADPGGARATSSFSTEVTTLSTPLATDAPVELAYGNPYPADWAEAGLAQMLSRIPLTLPNGMGKKSVSSWVGVGDLVPALSAGPIAPLVGPPRDLQVNGMAAYQNLAGIGESPTISWTAPAVGKADCYVLWVRRLQPLATTVSDTMMASLTTDETRVTVPPGILAPGSFYYVRVTAQRGCNPTAPAKVNNTSASASGVTGVLSP